MKTRYEISYWSVVDTKMEIPVPIRPLKSRILSSTIFQLDKTFREMVCAAIEQLRHNAKIVAQGQAQRG